MAGMVMVMVMVLLGRPEFAAGIGGAGTPYTISKHERKGEQGSSLGTATGTGTSGSDEASRTSSATFKRRGKDTSRTSLYGMLV